MTVKTSPGPWHRDKYGNLLDAKGNNVYFRSVSIACAGDGVAEAEANTDLITAAPELLEAVKYLLIRAHRYLSSQEELSKIAQLVKQIEST